MDHCCHFCKSSITKKKGRLKSAFEPPPEDNFHTSNKGAYMLNNKKLFITTMLATGSLFTSAVAAPITLDVAADNWVSGASGFRDKHYGGWDQISVQNGDSNNNEKERVGFFRFDLSPYTGGTISGAELQFLTNSQLVSDDFIIYGISDGGASENFGEGVTTTAGDNIETDPSLQTWNNSGYAYGNGDSLSDSASFGDLVNLGSMTGVNTGDVTVTFSSAALDTFLNNDGNNIATFLLFNTNGTGNIGGFKSKENGTNTGATLTLVPVPEPSSFALMFGGLALCIAANRRKR